MERRDKPRRPTAKAKATLEVRGQTRSAGPTASQKLAPSPWQRCRREAPKLQACQHHVRRAAPGRERPNWAKRPHSKIPTGNGRDGPAMRPKHPHAAESGVGKHTARESESAQACASRRHSPRHADVSVSWRDRPDRCRPESSSEASSPSSDPSCRKVRAGRGADTPANFMLSRHHRCHGDGTGF